MRKLSLLYPSEMEPVYNELPEESAHDLSLDYICGHLTDDRSEINLIKNIMTKISDDPKVIQYRCDIFEDILRFPEMREQIQELLKKVDFFREYGCFRKNQEDSGIWDLVQRLYEIGDYILSVESIYNCLNNSEIKSEGLIGLKNYVKQIYEDSGFEYLKKDIEALKVQTAHIKSLTLGINLNERFEPKGVGIISVNSKFFSKTGILSNFCDFINQGDEINDNLESTHNLTYKTVKDEKVPTGRIQSVFSQSVPQVNADGTEDTAVQVLDGIMTSMLSSTVKKLKSVLLAHVNVNSYEIVSLIPEFLYYVRWAEYVNKYTEKGFKFCKPCLIQTEKREMQTKGIYNWKLINKMTEKENSEELVTNDIDFSSDHRIYILTGANRGGKTTITQAIGIAYLLAQNGIYVPADEFIFSPADNIFTHFPADENKTMDLGRLGEESMRFKDMFVKATAKSLFLLNESFSTTSFEEGYYIATDVVKSLKLLGARTIFNTHMHKLAENVNEFNSECPSDSNTASLVVVVGSEGKRSYKVFLMPPQGQSYAHDIAKKYGVTFEQLCANINK